MNQANETIEVRDKNYMIMAAKNAIIFFLPYVSIVVNHDFISFIIFN